MNELSPAAAAPWARRGSTFSQAGLARPVEWAAPRDLDRLRASHARGRRDRPLVPTRVASPRLGDELLARLLAYGTPQETHRRDVLFRPGDEDADLIVVERGSVEVVRTATGNAPTATVAVVDAGGFVGELNLLDAVGAGGQAAASITDRTADTTQAQSCAGLFCFIGASAIASVHKAIAALA
jgi:CRP-like cAMP-binding protein